jgi:hypothetical protein
MTEEEPQEIPEPPKKKGRAKHICYSLGGSVSVREKQYELLIYIQNHLGYQTRSLFLKHALLTFCKQELDFINARKEANKEFIKNYKQTRLEWLEKKAKLQERRKEIAMMADPQDEGGDPFDEEDLVD